RCLESAPCSALSRFENFCPVIATSQPSGLFQWTLFTRLRPLITLLMLAPMRRRKRRQPEDLKIKIQRLGEASVAAVSKHGLSDAEKLGLPSKRRRKLRKRR